MEIIERAFNENIWSSNIFKRYFDNLNCIFLDIETTGISSEQNKVILAGILENKGSSFVIRQYFAEKKEEEKEILELIIEVLSKAHIIINYNATSFDIPFLNRRFQKNNIPFSIGSYCSFDLHKIIKKYGFITLPDYKLKTIEKYMGIERTDTISGQESIDIYNEYIKNKDTVLKEKILAHNFEDVYFLTKLLPILSKMDLHKIMFENCRYINTDMNCKIIIKKSVLKKHFLQVEGICTGKNSDYTAFFCGYEIQFSSEKNEFLLKIPLYEGNNSQYLLLNDLDFHYNKQISYTQTPEDVLIIKNGDQINHTEINSFLDVLLPYIFDKVL